MSTMTAPLAYIGSCNRCGATRRIAGHCGRYLCCLECITNPALIAERDAYLAEHPTGYFPMGVVKMARVRGKVSAQECGEACTSARGTSCACACAGKNHGDIYA